MDARNDNLAALDNIVLELVETVWQISIGELIAAPELRTRGCTTSDYVVDVSD